MGYRDINQKHKFLFVVDVRDWAYDDAAKNWKKLLPEYDIEILYLSDYPVIKTKEDKVHGEKKSIFNHKKYTGILFFYHRTLVSARLKKTKIPKSKIILCINNEKWLDKGAIDEFKTYRMYNSKVLTACNNKVLNSFKGIHNKLFRLSQSVSINSFNINRKNHIHNRPKNKIIVGWSGNPNNKIKNINFIKNVCKKANVKLKIAHKLNRKQLNDWYNKIDIVIISSTSEGGPLALLESGACGVPVISTPVGLVTEIIKNGNNGIIIPKLDSDLFVKAIKELASNPQSRYVLGNNLRKEIISNWTYESRLHEIKKVLQEVI